MYIIYFCDEFFSRKYNIDCCELNFDVLCAKKVCEIFIPLNTIINNIMIFYKKIICIIMNKLLNQYYYSDFVICFAHIYQRRSLNNG